MTERRTPVFLREATGLVRGFTTNDAIILAIGAIIGPTWVPIFASEWYLFPGVNVAGSFFFAGILSLVMGFYYCFITSVMPRSGAGGYVPLSRVIHPVVGMAFSFLFVIANILNLGFIANVMLTVGVSGPLGSYATLTNNSWLQNVATLIATPTWGFILGTVVIIVIGLIMIAGTSLIRVMNRIAIIVGTAGFVVIISVLLLTTQPQFQTAFNNFAGANAYQNIIATAHSSGWSVPSDWLTPTLLSIPLSWFAFLGAFYNTYWAGEVREIKKSMFVSVIISILYSTIFFAIVAFMMVQSFGFDFLSSIGYLFNAQPAQYTLSVPPWVNTFVAMMNSSPILNAILIASFIAWGYFLIISYFLIASRHFLAWSFDRTFPSVLANVSERFHTPVVSIIVTSVIAWVALIFYSFLPTILGAVNLAFLFIVAFMLDGLAGIALPWVKKNLFESAPALAKKKIVGIPVISILGAANILILVFLFVASAFNPGIAGPLGIGTELTVIVCLVIGALTYLGMKHYNAKRGLDLSLVFKEIPPE
ncbi:MAG: APC family permease [Candidatus Bathyarchaeia archaeon]